MSSFIQEIIKEVCGETAGLFLASKLGWLGKVTGKVVSNPEFQKVVTQKVGQAFGIVDETGKTLEEELLTVDLINFLGTVGSEVEDFISELHKEERGKEKAMAFRVFLASGLKKNSRTRKIFILNPDGKGKPAEETVTILDLEWGKNFIKRFLAKPTFQERVQFLDEKYDVFSTMKNKTEPHPIVEKAKSYVKKELGKVVKGEKRNRRDLNQTLSNWHERARNWRHSR